MREEVKAKWLEALRSGEYKQGRERLVQTGEGGLLWCCLGVLCDLFTKETGEQWKHDPLGPHAAPSELLPYAVRDWAWIYDKDPLVKWPNGEEQLLSVLNDGKRGSTLVAPLSFEEIADVIERHL